MESVTQQILKKITPTPEERQRVDALSRRLQQQIIEACQTEGVPAKVRVEGSVAKDTYLNENPDIDIFIRLPKSIPRKNLGEVGLKIAKKAAGDAEQLERFAEHPYLEIIVDDYRVDIVPCYDAARGEWQSATDRTPYHTDYIKTHLSEPLHGEVRLLKRFMQGIGVYGAEIKVGGFSGYLCELLVMHYGSFAGVIEAFAAYSERVVIDPEGYYKERQTELPLLFPEPLVIVDPVDKGRNVASAVQPQKLYSFIAASRAFQTKPSEQFFYPPKTHAVSPDIIQKQLTNRGSAFVFLFVGEAAAVPDVLWGQLYRSKRSLRRLLETNGYTVLQDAVWSNERSMTAFVFELEQQLLPNVKKHLGPPLERGVECEKFLAKYVSDKSVLAGPYVEEGHWVVELPRKSTNAVALLYERLADGGKNAGVADLVAQAARERLEVLVNGEVLKVYVEHSDFAVFLTEFLSGKPFWLEAQ
ncbi:MAG: CCA tRNA nucleotidyltransferase [Candidatus Bathyarchaeota archaeon]|nr:CCA tRNA nucleotidyltransferase [Candidatus Bathyarchaeota archaeon]